MAKKPQFDFDLIVIGRGAGGSAAASIAARNDKRVAIVEADTFGGDSPNWSDVPTKALLHAAHLYDEARHGARFGLRSGTLGYNYPSLRAWKDLAVKRTGAGGGRRAGGPGAVPLLDDLPHRVVGAGVPAKRQVLA